jgi:hypothetical protein
LSRIADSTNGEWSGLSKVSVLLLGPTRTVTMPSVMTSKKGRAALADWRWRRRLRAWRRAEFEARAEAESMRSLGRPMTRDEMKLVFRRYPGHL